MVPSGSVDPVVAKATASGALPVVGLPDAAACGAWFATATIVTVDVLVAPSLSVTVSVATRVPAVR